MVRAALIAIAASTGVADAQRSGDAPSRFGLALGVVTPPASLPSTLTASLSATVVQREGNPFQLQLDGTATSLDNAALTAIVTYHRPIRGVNTYALLGAGYKSFFDGRTTTYGLGATFAYRGVPLFSEFRIYYPGQELLSGIRLGVRF